MVLREADIQDAACLADAWYAMLDEVGLLAMPAPGWRDLLIADFAKGIERLRQRWCVIEEDDRVVATGGLFLRRDPLSLALTGLSGTVAGMYTSPGYRRRGYAAAILDRLIAIARSEGCLMLRLRASDQGRPLYERYGFLPGDDMYLSLHP
jgi:GNAT superfamily N-acetyltransferase